MQFCKPPQAVENMTGFVACSLRIFSHIDTLYQSDKTEKEGKMT
jgi:hypothetical protein